MKSQWNFVYHYHYHYIIAPTFLPASDPDPPPTFWLLFHIFFLRSIFFSQPNFWNVKTKKKFLGGGTFFFLASETFAPPKSWRWVVEKEKKFEPKKFLDAYIFFWDAIFFAFIFFFTPRALGVLPRHKNYFITIKWHYKPPKWRRHYIILINEISMTFQWNSHEKSVKFRMII